MDDNCKSKTNDPDYYKYNGIHCGEVQLYSIIHAMAYICDNCGKGKVVGRQSSHGRGVAGKRWKKRAQKTLKVFKPNLQKVAVMISGKSVQMKLCSDCISKFKNTGKIKKYQAASI